MRYCYETEARYLHRTQNENLEAVTMHLMRIYKREAHRGKSLRDKWRRYENKVYERITMIHHMEDRLMKQKYRLIPALVDVACFEKDVVHEDHKDCYWRWRDPKGIYMQHFAWESLQKQYKKWIIDHSKMKAEDKAYYDHGGRYERTIYLRFPFTRHEKW